MPASDNDNIIFDCGYCQTKVQGAVLGRADYYDHESPPEEWMLTKCSSCHRPNVIGREFYGTHGDEEVFDDWRIFPPRARTFGHEVPKAIRSTYDEAQTVLRAGAFVATALMCRRVIETLAKDKGATSRNLDKKLEELVQQGVIDRLLFEWADALRLAGNDAAHSVDTAIVKQDADDLMTFTEAIIDYVYILRARFEEFEKRRSPTKLTTKAAKKPR